MLMFILFGAAKQA